MRATAERPQARRPWAAWSLALLLALGGGGLAACSEESQDETVGRDAGDEGDDAEDPDVGGDVGEADEQDLPGVESEEEEEDDDG